MVHPAFPVKDVPVRKQAPPSRKSQAIATHAAPGVNGHGIHGIHGPQPNPQETFFPFTPTFSGDGGEHNFLGGAAGVRAFCGFRGSSGVGWEGLRIVPSITCPEIPGRTIKLPFPGFGSGRWKCGAVYGT